MRSIRIAILAVGLGLLAACSSGDEANTADANVAVDANLDAGLEADLNATDVNATADLNAVDGNAANLSDVNSADATVNNSL